MLELQSTFTVNVKQPFFNLCCNFITHGKKRTVYDYELQNTKNTNKIDPNMFNSISVNQIFWNGRISLDRIHS